MAANCAKTCRLQSSMGIMLYLYWANPIQTFTCTGLIRHDLSQQAAGSTHLFDCIWLKLMLECSRIVFDPWILFPEPSVLCGGSCKCSIPPHPHRQETSQSPIRFLHDNAQLLYKPSALFLLMRLCPSCLIQVRAARLALYLQLTYLSCRQLQQQSFPSSLYPWRPPWQFLPTPPVPSWTCEGRRILTRFVLQIKKMSSYMCLAARKHRTEGSQCMRDATRRVSLQQSLRLSMLWCTLYLKQGIKWLISLSCTPLLLGRSLLRPLLECL